MLLRLKFQANTYSFERVVTLFVGYYFSSGHRVDLAQAFDTVDYIYDILLAKLIWSIIRGFAIS